MGVYVDYAAGDYNNGQLPEFLDDYGDFLRAPQPGISGSPSFFPLSETELALVAPISTEGGAGMRYHEDILNATVANADSVAGVSTGYTVTVAPDPTA